LRRLLFLGVAVSALALHGCGGAGMFSAKSVKAAASQRHPKSIGPITEVSTGTSYSPGLIGLGSGGTVWLTPYQGAGYSSPNVGRIDSSNTVTFVNSTSTLFDRNGIVLGADGNQWFCDQTHDQVGAVASNNSVTFTHLTANSHPIGIAVGSDSAIWIAENGLGKIGRISSTGVYTEYGSGLSDVRSITSGPDGNVWFTEHGNAKIGRITPAGVITQYAIPTGGAPALIRPGPDGNVWFTEYESNRVGYATPAGTITEFAAPGGPNGIAAGPDGNMWYTEMTGNAIGVISPSGASVAVIPLRRSNSQPYDIVATSGTVYFTERLGTAIGIIQVSAQPVGAITEVPIGGSYSAGFMALGNNGFPWFTPYAQSGSSPNIGRIDQNNAISFVNSTTTLFDRNGIILGPDGNEWFSDQSHDQVGYVTPTGAVSFFPLAAGSHPIGITVGSDAAIWIAENGTGRIGRMTVTGAYTEYGAGLSDVRTVARGADGNVWFSEHGNSKLGKITPAGSITEYAIPSGGKPAVAKPGPDGNMWFSEYESNRIGFSTPSGTITEYPAPGGPNGLTTGPDGNIWYVEYDGSGIGAISPSGTAIAQLSTPTANSLPYDIVSTCNSVYFTERGSSMIGIYPVAATATIGAITEVSTGSTYSAGFMALGSDGYPWFAPYDGTGSSSPSLGRINSSNVVSFVNTTTTLFDRNGIVLGPDGNEWFSDQQHDKVGYVTPAGTVTLLNLTAGSHPIGITVGSDAAIWIAENGTGKIGRMTITGSYTEYGSGLNDVRTVARGADGNVWFSEHGNSKIGKITPAGMVTEYAIPTGGKPAVIKPGPDGNLWFTEYESSRIGFSTTSGAITEFAAPGGPNGLTAGPDGNIWYVEYDGSAVDVIGVNGAAIARYPTPTANSQPYDIVSSCNSVYFSERMATKVGILRVQ
jgi:streptogramin lyase